MCAGLLRVYNIAESRNVIAVKLQRKVKRKSRYQSASGLYIVNSDIIKSCVSDY